MVVEVQVKDKEPPVDQNTDTVTEVKEVVELMETTLVKLSLKQGKYMPIN